MSTRRGTENQKRRDSAGASGSVSGGRGDSRVTVVEFEETLAEPGIHAGVSNLPAKARPIEKEIGQSRSCRKREHMC